MIKGHDFADKICGFMGWLPNPKKSDDGGIDAWANNQSIPIQIKNHRNKIGRPDIQKFVGALNGIDQGLFVAWDFSPAAWDYRIEVQQQMGKTVEFIKVGDILNGILIDTDKRFKLEKLYQDLTG